MMELEVVRAAINVSKAASVLVKSYYENREVSRIAKIDLEESLRLYQSSCRMDGVGKLICQQCDIVIGAWEKIERQELDERQYEFLMRKVETASDRLDKIISDYTSNGGRFSGVF